MTEINKKQDLRGIISIVQKHCNEGQNYQNSTPLCSAFCNFIVKLFLFERPLVYTQLYKG